jgi:uncharacterized protein YbjT (DUF2867 family)
MSDKRTVLVSGATGAQGGSVVDALLANGRNVIAVARDPGSPAARALTARGAEVRRGDYSDTESLRIAAKGADSAFVVTTPFESGPEGEITQGRAMIDALRNAAVGHIVFSSVGSADKATGIPHFDSKYKVEEYLAASGVPYSIVAPVYFMENLTAPYALPALQSGTVSAAMPADRTLQQIAVSNIGEFAAALIERRETVFGRRFDIAGDELSFTEIATLVSGVLDRKMTFQSFPAEALKAQSEDLGLMFEWFDTDGYSADIAGLRSAFPEVNWLTYQQWLAAQDWSALDAGNA